MFVLRVIQGFLFDLQPQFADNIRDLLLLGGSRSILLLDLGHELPGLVG